MLQLLPKLGKRVWGPLLAPMLKNNTDLVIAGIAPKSTKHAPKFAALHRQWRRLSISEIFSN